MRKKRIWIAAVLIAAVGIGVLLIRNTPGAKLSRILERTLAQESLCMELSAELPANGTTFSAGIDQVTIGDTRITRIGTDDYYIYMHQNLVFFENGKAYRLDDGYDADMMHMLVRACRYLDVDRSGDQYTITVAGEDASMFLLPTAETTVSTLDITVTAPNGRLESIRFLSESDSIDVVMTVCQPRSVEIPNAVLTAIQHGTDAVTDVLSAELLRLIGAWYRFGAQEILSADLNLHVSCGVLQLAQDFRYHQSRTEKISALQKGDFALYFNDRAVCTADGTILTQGTTQGVDAAVLLPGLAYELCLNGDLQIEGEVYQCELDEAAMQKIAAAIAPESQDLNLTYTAGIVRVELENGALKRIDFVINGTVRVLFADVAASIAAELVPDAAASAFVVPDAVRNALSES